MKMNVATDPFLNEVVERMVASLERNTEAITKNDPITAIQEQLKELEGKLNNCLTTIENDMPTKVHEKIESSPTWAQIVNNKKNDQPSISLDDMKKAVHEVTEFDKEMHMRDRGVVIYRIPEKEDQQQENRKREDAAFIKEILRQIECDDLETEITHLERLGKFDPAKCKDEKYRPIKLRFTLKDQRDRMLKSLGRLKYAPDHIKKVSIRHDLNEVQRQEWYNKIKQAKERSEQSATHFYRVRGQPGHYNVIAIPKNRPQTT